MGTVDGGRSSKDFIALRVTSLSIESQSGGEEQRHEPAGAEEHPVHRWTGGGGERGDPALGIRTFRGHEGREDAAMDNMDGAELYGRGFTVNYVFPAQSVSLLFFLPFILSFPSLLFHETNLLLLLLML
ncbi:hypothetical protein BHM03_00052347 [Ensete ventricosum]|nr:hypothetical protein BHM03_00052347 [Ensete ventricosum]